jgi:fructose-1,6-bisphosphatase
MPHRRTTFSKFIIESLRRAERDPELPALLNDVMTACKLISLKVSRGTVESRPRGLSDPPESRKPLNLLANEIMQNLCEFGGQLAGTVSGVSVDPYLIPEGRPQGPYLLLFTPLDGASNIDVNMSVGTIFSVLRADDRVTNPGPAAFLQPGTQQVAAGYALHGPASMLVASLGDGVHGFTLEREIGAYVLTHPAMKIPATSDEVAIDVSVAGLWDPPVHRYIEECTEGEVGPRGRHFDIRRSASSVAEVHRILVRGGVFVHPRESWPGSPEDRDGLLCSANPLAMLVEQAGGAASNGRQRLMEIQPSGIHEHVPMVLGSPQEVERLAQYYAAYDRGEPISYISPLFNTRSLFRAH